MSYKSDWRATPRCVHAIVLSDGTTLLRMRRRYLRAERWGLFAFADPLRPACQTSVVWLPHMSRRTIRARCNLNVSNHSADVIRLASFRTKRVAVTGVDGVSVVTMKSGDSRTSLVAHGWPVLTRPARVTFEVDGFDELNARIDCLRMLQRLADPASPSLMPRCHRLSMTDCGRRCSRSTAASPARVIVRLRQRFSGTNAFAGTGMRPVVSSKNAPAGWSPKATRL